MAFVNVVGVVVTLNVAEGTTRLADKLCVRLPAVPVIVNGTVPADCWLAMLNVNADTKLLLPEEGLKVGVIFDPRPEADKVTVALKLGPELTYTLKAGPDA